MPEARLLLVGDKHTRSGFKAQIQDAPNVSVGYEGSWNEVVALSDSGIFDKVGINVAVVANTVGGLNALIALIASGRLWRVGLSAKVFDRPGAIDVDLLNTEPDGNALAVVARGLVSISEHRPEGGFWGIRFPEISQPRDFANRHSTPIFANGRFQQVLKNRRERTIAPAML